MIEISSGTLIPPSLNAFIAASAASSEVINNAVQDLIFSKFFFVKS